MQLSLKEELLNTYPSILSLEKCQSDTSDKQA